MTIADGLTLNRRGYPLAKHKKHKKLRKPIFPADTDAAEYASVGVFLDSLEHFPLLHGMVAKVTCRSSLSLTHRYGSDSDAGSSLAWDFS